MNRQVCFLSLLSAAAAHGATVHFNVNTNTGSEAMLYSVTVHDNTPNLLTFAVAVADSSPNNGDIVGFYMNFGVANANTGYGLSDFSGSAITKLQLNSSNVQGGGLGQAFQFGLGIGSVGAAADFYDSFTFTMNLKNGLTLADLDLIGVRAMSVSPDATWANPGEGSSKTFVERGEDPVPTPVVPLPTGAGLAGLGLLVIGARRRRSL